MNGVFIQELGWKSRSPFMPLQNSFPSPPLPYSPCTPILSLSSTPAEEGEVQVQRSREIIRTRNVYQPEYHPWRTRRKIAMIDSVGDARKDKLRLWRQRNHEKTWWGGEVLVQGRKKAKPQGCRILFRSSCTIDVRRGEEGRRREGLNTAAWCGV